MIKTVGQRILHYCEDNLQLEWRGGVIVVHEDDEWGLDDGEYWHAPIRFCPFCGVNLADEFANSRAKS